MNKAIIVSAGKGERIGTDKVFLELRGKEILAHTIERFEDCNEIDNIILVVRKEKINRTKELVDKYIFKKIEDIVAGGKERQDSVYNGLRECDYIVIHDAVRPLVNKRVIKRCLENAKEYGAAAAAVLSKDSVKIGGEFVIKTLNRNKIWLVQTPQAFKYEILKNAHERARKENFYGTDDSELVERMGYKVKIVPSYYENIKITTLEDLAIVSSLL